LKHISQFLGIGVYPVWVKTFSNFLAFITGYRPGYTWSIFQALD